MADVTIHIAGALEQLSRKHNAKGWDKETLDFASEYILDLEKKVAALKTAAKLLESDRDIEREMRLGLESEVERLRAENDMLKDTMIRACVWLDVHGRPGIPDVTRTLSEAVASTVKQGGPQ